MIWLSKKNPSLKFSCEFCLPIQKKYYSETDRVQGKLPASFGVFQLEQGLGCTVIWGSRHSKLYLCANLDCHWHPHTSPRVYHLGRQCSNNNTAGNVRLPKLELKRYMVNLSRGCPIINLFNTTIHKNETISNITKMQFSLRNLLIWQVTEYLVW